MFYVCFFHRNSPRVLYRPNLFQETEPSPRLSSQQSKIMRCSYSKKDIDSLHDVGDISIEDIESGGTLRASSGKSLKNQQRTTKYRGLRSNDNLENKFKYDSSSDNIDESVMETLETVSTKKMPTSNQSKSDARPKSRHSQSRPASRANSRAASRFGR